MLLNKVLIIYVTRNNPVLLQHSFESFSKYDAGYSYEFLIVDHQSDNPQQLNVLENLSKKHKVVTYDNNRVEVSFNKAYQENKNYKYYFFLHDDVSANKDNWLKVFIDRMNSGYVEKIVENTEFAKFPIGRVAAMHQPWRSYSSILGYPVQCLFLEKVLEIMRPGKVPQMFKHCDPDRCLITNECLATTNGIRNLDEFKDMFYKSDMEGLKFGKITKVLEEYLPYYDEGIPPKNLYPPGQWWNKLTLTSEFLNSTEPLITGYRTVGLEGDGYLEQIHGYDEPWGNDFIHHFGMPNVKQFLAKVFNGDAEEISKNFNNKVFLLKSDKAIKDYFKLKRI